MLLHVKMVRLHDVLFTNFFSGGMLIDIRTGWLNSGEGGPEVVEAKPETEGEGEEEEGVVDDAYKVEGASQKCTVLEKAEIDKLRQVKGFPHAWRVEAAPAIRLCLPKDSFVGREWKTKVESENGELGVLTASVTRADGTEVPVTIDG